jgi:hypothetical protein
MFLVREVTLLYLIGKKILVDALPEGEFSVSLVTALESCLNPSIIAKGHPVKSMIMP